jgi:hypothetical protein
VQRCMACLSLAPTQADPPRPLGSWAETQPTWIYSAGVNRMSIARDGITFRLPGHGFFRRRLVRWGEAEAFAPEKYSVAGSSRDKGAGKKLGNTLAWRISLRRRTGRPIAIPVPLGPVEQFSEEKASALAMAMNKALALPREH